MDMLEHKPRRRLLLRLERSLDSHAMPSSCSASYTVSEERMCFYDDDEVQEQNTRVSWQTVLIKHRPPPHRLLPQGRIVPSLPTQFYLDSPVRIHEDDLRSFINLCGAVWTKVLNADSRHDLGHGNLVRHPPTIYVFYVRDYQRTVTILITFGQCERKRLAEDGQTSAVAPVWATVRTIWMMQWQRDKDNISRSDVGHVCLEDHVQNWPNSQKIFNLDGEGQSQTLGDATLSFTPCPINPRRTLVLHPSFRSVYARERTATSAHR